MKVNISLYTLIDLISSESVELNFNRAREIFVVFILSLIVDLVGFFNSVSKPLHVNREFACLPLCFQSH